MEARKITIDGEALRLVDAKAAADGLSFKDATAQLIEQGAPVDAVAVPGEVLPWLDPTTLETATLFDELRRRCDDTAMVRALREELAHALALRQAECERADAAEAKLARIGAIYAGAQ